MADAQLKSLVERIERLNEEKKTINEDTKEVYKEAKSLGYDPKVIREVIKIRKADSDALDEMEALVETYLNSVGR